jgi:cytochrome oxidase Cu insertion factor (SCO1/SenC/PrrC family)
MDTRIILRYITCLIFLIFDFSLCLAQGWQKLPVSITGTISGKNREGKDSVQVYLNENYSLFGTVNFAVPIRKDGRFVINLKPIDHPANIRIGIKNYPQILVNRVIEPGDTTNLEINVTTDIPAIKYTGNNVAKYNCLDDLELEREKFIKKLNFSQKDFRSETDQQVSYAARHRLNLSGYFDILKILDVYKGKVSPSMSKYIAGTYEYLILGQWDLQIRFDFGKSKKELDRRKIGQIYNHFKFPDYNIDPLIASSNPYFIKYQLGKSRTKLFIEHQGAGFTYREFYQSLKNDFHDTVRERILAQFLYDPASSQDVLNFNMIDYEYCLNDAYSLIKDSLLKAKVANKFNTKKGAPAFNFTMPDTTGTAITLANFKGKVILLDFWFTGCTGCAAFSRMFHNKVYPKIQDKPKFEVVSVNIDENRKSWLKGIYSGKYTQKHHVNLTTGGLDHPLLKYYNVVAFPYVLLIDGSGKIYAKIDQSLDSEQILNLIHSALKEPI